MAQLNSQVTGISGKSYTLTNLIGTGGEGSVYDTTIPNRVVKIYNASNPSVAARLPELEKKLSYMTTKLRMNFISKETHNCLVTWPEDVLYENGKFVGFLMPKITGAKSILKVNRRGKSAQSVVPGYNWQKAALIAENLAKVIRALHKYNIVVGDMNSNNILVYPNCDVVILDADSFDIRTDTGAHYKCGVGTEAYLAPELQGKDLGKEPAPFNRETDEFAVAVHIFQTLMGNFHPFSVKALDTSISRPENKQVHNISVGNCPFLRQIPGCTIPVGAPDMNRLLPEILINDFRATFGYQLNPGAPGYNNALQAAIHNRTHAEDWYQHLHAFNQNAARDLVRCSLNPEHYYLRTKECCELCAAAERAQAASAAAMPKSNPQPQYAPKPQPAAKPAAAQPSRPPVTPAPKPAAVAEAKPPVKSSSFTNFLGGLLFFVFIFVGAFFFVQGTVFIQYNWGKIMYSQANYKSAADHFEKCDIFYKDSAAQYVDSMKQHVMQNPTESNPDTCRFMEKLYLKDMSFYNSYVDTVYRWKVSNFALNGSKADFTTNSSTIYEPERLFVHFTAENAAPHASAKFTVTVELTVDDSRVTQKDFTQERSVFVTQMSQEEFDMYLITVQASSGKFVIPSGVCTITVRDASNRTLYSNTYKILS